MAYANPAFFKRRTVDQETVRILGVTFEQVCIGLRTGGCDDVKQAIANKIIEIAKTGERNPDLLCERALKGIRQEAAPRITTAKACRKSASRWLVPLMRNFFMAAADGHCQPLGIGDFEFQCFSEAILI